MYEITRKDGIVTGVRRIKDGAWSSIGGRIHEEFLEWNAKQPVPLDLSDQPPEPPPVDTEKEAIQTILNKADADISAPEFKIVMLRLARRILAKGG